MELQAAALEEGAGFHGQLFVGDVAIHVAAGIEPDLLGGDRADDAAAGLDDLGLNGAFHMAGLADGEAGHDDVAAHDAVDMQLGIAADAAVDGGVGGDQRGDLGRARGFSRGCRIRDGVHFRYR